MAAVILNIGRTFSRFPLGRHLSDGSGSGEEFRERVLVPLLSGGAQEIVVELDDALGYGSSFLEEAFGGLVRRGWRSEDLLRILTFVSEDLSLIDEIEGYIKEAADNA